jgi:hypothetical protein
VGRGVSGREGRGVRAGKAADQMVGEGVEKNGVKARVDAAWY